MIRRRNYFVMVGKPMIEEMRMCDSCVCLGNIDLVYALLKRKDEFCKIIDLLVG